MVIIPRDKLRGIALVMLDSSDRRVVHYDRDLRYRYDPLNILRHNERHPKTAYRRYYTR